MLGELPSLEIERLLETELVARLGCHGDDRTYVVPITFVYADGALVGHSASVSGRLSCVYRIRLTEKTGRFERTP
jgi:nitroimidazol reductase NimA-like FMN-containing flavoprotein (pyridoxamine 5'-phosphate oxidase superfamily)